jgi:hypothetical protein
MRLSTLESQWQKPDFHKFLGILREKLLLLPVFTGNCRF